MRQLIITAQARRQLLDIAMYIARDNPARANSFVDELEAVCGSLVEFPRAYPRLGGRRRDIRKRTYGDYLIIYEVHARSVRVFAVVHGATDYMRKLR